ncbi:MAG: hypothetical protein NTX73_13100 [Rhodobacterales bacterium]|nr:hypothetical protein [Rhodobacterales bacterium]
MSKAVLQIASQQPNGVATHQRLRKEIPKLINLTPADLAPSVTRPGEPMWHQIVRNIKSHDKEPGNYIAEGYLEHVPRVGYKITVAGTKHLRAAKP